MPKAKLSDEDLWCAYLANNRNAYATAKSLSYAKDKGFLDQHFGPSCATVINTSLPDTHPDYIKPFWSVQEGAEYLKFLRKRKAA